MFDKMKDFVKNHKKGVVIGVGSTLVAGLATLLLALNHDDCTNDDVYEIQSEEDTTEESSDEN